jgi:hypothetical protein
MTRVGAQRHRKVHLISQFHGCITMLGFMKVKGISRCNGDSCSIIFFLVVASYSIIWDTLLVAQLVEALRYKPEGRDFDSRLCHWNFSLT